jgi:cyclic pyranopterin phosphate synthase
LKDAGLKRVNISLHTIRRETYEKICGRNNLTEALAGLDRAISAGLKPIKINMVLLKGINDGELWEMFEFASEKGAVLQVIEFETDKAQLNHHLFLRHHLGLSDLRDQLLKHGQTIGANPLHNREKFFVDKDLDGFKLKNPLVVELQELD